MRHHVPYLIACGVGLLVSVPRAFVPAHQSVGAQLVGRVALASPVALNEERATPVTTGTGSATVKVSRSHVTKDVDKVARRLDALLEKEQRAEARRAERASTARQ